MGSHSVGHKKRKQREHRKRKHFEKKHVTPVNSECEASYETSAVESEQDDFFTRCEKRFWASCKDQMDQVNNFQDKHPAILTEEDSAVKVIVANTDQEFTCLQETTLKQYVNNLQQQEKSALKLAKTFRNRAEELERQLDGALLEVERAKVEARKSTSEICKFWRDQIYEKGSRGGRMVMEALCN